MLNYKKILVKPFFIVVAFFVLSFGVLAAILSHYLHINTNLLATSVCISFLLSLLLYLLVWYHQTRMFASWNRFRLWVEKSDNVFWVLDYRTFRYKYISDACFKNTGYTPADYYNRTIMDMLSADSMAKVKRILDDKIKLLKTGKTKSVDVTFEAQQHTRWRSKNWVQSTATLTIDNFGRIEIVGITRIINEEKKVEAQIQANEKMFLAINNNISDVIWILNWSTKKYTYVSQSVVNFSGYTPAEILNSDKQFDFLIFSEQTNFINDKIQSTIAGYKAGELPNASFSFESQFIRKDKKLVYFEIIATIILNEEFEPVEIIGVSRDTSKSKELELKLRESETLLQAIASNSNDHIWILDPKTMQYTYNSASGYYIHGYTVEEMSNITFAQLFSPESIKIINNFITEKVTDYVSGKTEKCHGVTELQIRHKNGNWIWIEISATGVIDKTNTLVEIYGTSRVIEDRRKIEVELKNNEKRWQAVTLNSNDLIWILDFKSMKYTYMSPSSMAINGCTAEEAMQSRTLLNSFLPKDVSRINNIITEKIEQYKRGAIPKVQAVFEVQLVRKDRSLIWIEVSATATVNSNFEPVEIIGISRDIEDRKRLELALKESEEKYRYLTEKSSDCIWKFNFKTMKFTYLSESVYKLFGFHPEEVYEMPLTDFMLPDSVDRLFVLVGDLIADAKQNNRTTVDTIYEAQQIAKDGTVIWIEATASGTLNDNGELNELMGITRIIDSRKRLELALKESEEKYRYLTERSMDCIWTLNTNLMQFTYISEASRKLFGFSPQEVYEMQLSDLILPESLDKLMQLLFGLVVNAQKAAQKTIETIYELQQYTKSGQIVWVESSATGTLNEEWELEEIIGVSRVIEDKKWLELTLKESEEKYRLITENQRDIIWMMDLQTLHYTFMSGACYELTGFTVEEYLNMTAQEALPPESFAFITNLVTDQMQKFYSGEVKYPSATFELQQYHKNGSLTWVEISARMLIDHVAGPQIIATTRNIEDRKATELQILKQNEDLEILNATKDKFFSIIAHDLKNPLAALINVSTVFTDYLPQMKPSDIEKNVFILTNSAQHIYDLFENLLEWARSSSGNMTFLPTKNSITDIVERCIDDIKTQALVKQISVKMEAQTSNHDVECDINMIYTVVRNLISNAIKFSFENSTIEIKIEDYSEDNNFVQVSVADHGVGIEPEEVSKLFRIDKKVVSTKGTAAEKGTGLGLILCQEFIAKHNCKIWVISEKNKGTTFLFTLLKAG